MKMRRDATWWITYPDLNWPNIDGAEKIKRHAEDLAEANVSTVILFGTHFRWDYLPVFEILHDYIATVAEECHKRGMELFDHHSVNLVHRYRNRAEMRFMMANSLPHLPVSPSYEAAKSWTYDGQYLNDWRQIDVRTGEPLYFPQYQGEGFCHRNPGFIHAYQHYVQKLVSDTNIDGLLADDAMYFMYYAACGCESCRAAFKKQTGLDLPPVRDTAFWGNWDNPAWKQWLDFRFDASGAFMEKVRAVLPEGKMLGYCGYHSDRAQCDGNASDARHFTRGANYLSIEISGNCPPYHGDPKTINYELDHHVISGCHHLAVARERGIRCYVNGYAFSEKSALTLFGLSKITGADLWLGTLKARLGLPDHILATLPDEDALVRNIYAYEKENEALYGGENLAQAALFFSYETRNHSLFGAKIKGYHKDFLSASGLLFKAGIAQHVVFEIPENTDVYRLLVMPSPYLLTEEEKKRLDRFLKTGGKVLMSGPSAYPAAESVWKLENKAGKAPEEFFNQCPDGVHQVMAPWLNEAIDPAVLSGAWAEKAPGLYYHPVRFSDMEDTADFTALLKKFAPALPVTLVSQEGYLSALFEDRGRYYMHFLAAEYETDIDHRLDEMRYHRSRVNFVDQVKPVKVSQEVRVKAEKMPALYAPLSEGAGSVRKEGDSFVVTLPKDCIFFTLAF